MPEHYLTYLAYASPGLMLLGYLLYIRQTLKHEIEPNPTTWVMFAYGTGLLAVLELDSLLTDYGMVWNDLLTWDGLAAVLPIVATPFACALCSLWVAGICIKRGKVKWPEKKLHGVSFSADLLLTAAYATAWGLLTYGAISAGERELATLIFLVGSNLTTITAFIPILDETKEDPKGERAIPWMVWTMSYATLAVVTFYDSGPVSELMIYPIMNTVLHGAVAILALPYRRKKKRLAELDEGYRAF